jgi:hypothetical protein
MDPKLRTILIGLISLAAVLAAYMLYSRLSKNPQIGSDIGAISISPAAESNIGDFNGEIGKIADVGIAALKKPVFRHLKNGRVDREFGFEELLHQVEGEWEIEKPYLNIFQNNFKCFVTAERGKVQVESAIGGPSPKDATFTGNVVVHILPEPGSDINESFIYLDNVAFISEKSLLSTPGPVRFVSRDAQMLGTGLVLIYNDQLQRLELFRIVQLAALHLKSSWASLFSRNSQQKKHQAQSTPPQRRDAQKQKGTPATTGQDAAEQGQGQYYQCVLSKNVVIDSPEQLVFTKDRFSINNIFWSQASAGEPNESIRQAQDTLKTTSKAEKIRDVVVDSKDSGPILAFTGTTLLPQKDPALRQGEQKSAQVSRDTIVTCDNGIMIFPMGSAIIQNDFNQPIINRAGPATKPLRDFNDSKDRTIFIADRIDYDLVNENTLAAGPLELTFYVNDAAEAESPQTTMPVDITAQKEAKFLSAAKQVIFQGDCICTMSRAEPNDVQHKYTLSAPQVTANLTSGKTDSNSNIEHLNAEGGTVKLQSVKTVKTKLLNGVELECTRTDYDANRQIFKASGPGMIILNNSNVEDPNEQQSGKFSLRRPCYAFLRDFATVQYFIEDNRIIADAEPGRTLRIDYFPVVKGGSGRQVTATAVHAEVGFVQIADGQNELSMLTASGGITYNEEEGNELLGSKMFYDREKSILKVEGDESEPCYFNGALVERIIYDPKTGKFEVPLAGPGALQINR